MTEDADIGFRVYYVLDKEEMDVIPWTRVNCHTVMEEGMIVCTRAVPCTATRLPSPVLQI